MPRAETGRGRYEEDKGGERASAKKNSVDRRCRFASVARARRMFSFYMRLKARCDKQRRVSSLVLEEKEARERGSGPLERKENENLKKPSPTERLHKNKFLPSSKKEKNEITRFLFHLFLSKWQPRSRPPSMRDTPIWYASRAR